MMNYPINVLFFFLRLELEFLKRMFLKIIVKKILKLTS